MLAFLLVILLLAAILDFYKGKIPNYLVVTGATVGVLRLFLKKGLWSAVLHIPGILFPILILFPLYKRGTLGAGDVKLFSMMGCYFPLMETATCMFVSFLFGAVFSLAILCKNHNLTHRFTYLWEYLKESFATGKFNFYYKNQEEQNPNQILNQESKLHFAFPIFLAALLHVGGIY